MSFSLKRILNDLQFIQLDDHGYLIQAFHEHAEGEHFHNVQDSIESEFNINLNEVL